MFTEPESIYIKEEIFDRALTLAKIYTIILVEKNIIIKHCLKTIQFHRDSFYEERKKKKIGAGDYLIFPWKVWLGRDKRTGGQIPIICNK